MNIRREQHRIAERKEPSEKALAAIKAAKKPAKPWAKFILFFMLNILLNCKIKKVMDRDAL